MANTAGQWHALTDWCGQHRSAVGLPEDNFRTKTSNDTKFDGNPDNTYAAYTLQKGALLLFWGVANVNFSKH